MTQKSALQCIALICLDRLHLISHIETINVQQAVQSTQMGSIQCGHVETYLQVLWIELDPSHLGDIVFGEGEDTMSRNFVIVRIVHVLGELESAQHIQLGQVDNNRYVVTGVGH